MCTKGNRTHGHYKIEGVLYGTMTKDLDLQIKLVSFFVSEIPHESNQNKCSS